MYVCVHVLQNFVSKDVRSKEQFLRGFAQVLPRFSPPMQQKLVLPVLLTELGQLNSPLVPLLLPHIFVVSKSMDSG